MAFDWLAPLSMTSSDPAGHFGCLKSFKHPHLGECNMYCLRCVYNWIGKHTWLAISTVFSEMKDFSRSQAVT